MTQHQAETLIAQISRETRYVETTIKRIHKGEQGFAIVATLTHKRLTQTFLTAEEWESIKQAWNWFVPEWTITETAEKPLKVRGQRYLVDGVPMGIHQSSHGYWKGFYRDGMKTRTKYFGTIDPRGDYPVYQESEAAS